MKEPAKQFLTGKFLPEIIGAISLIALGGGFLLLNFWFGFSLPVYAAVAVFGLLVPFVYPRAGFYAITFLLLIFAKFFTLQSLIVDQQEYKFYLVDIFVVGILCGLLVRLLRRRIDFKLRWPDVSLLFFLAMVILYFFLSIGKWQGDFALSFSSLKNYAFYPLFYFIAYWLIDSRQTLKIWLSFALSGAIGIIGFIAYGLINGRGLWTEITPLSTAGSRILDFDHAFYLCLGTFFILSYLFFKKNELSRHLFILPPIFMIGIVGSLMRHLWIALAAACFVVFLRLPRSAYRLWRQVMSRYAGLLLVMVLLLLLVINLRPFGDLNRLTMDISRQMTGRAVSLLNADDSSIAWRGVVWQSVWSEYQDNFFAGLGFGQKIFIDMGDYRDYVEVRNIHNSFLAVFAQLGLLGFGLFAVFMIGAVGKLLNFAAKNPEALLMKYALLGVMIFCSVAFLFQPYLEANFFNIPFWLSLGLVKRTYEGAFGA